MQVRREVVFSAVVPLPRASSFALLTCPKSFIMSSIFVGVLVEGCGVAMVGGDATNRDMDDILRRLVYIRTDIEVKPGTKEASIHAHKALLMEAVKSSIFRNILDSEDKAPPNESITLSKMTNEELHSLIEFLLYRGNLPKEMIERNLYSLAVAANEYDIAPLRKVCEHHLKESLSTCNALDILELSDRCSFKSLKDATLDFIAKNYKDIFFAKGYVDFTIQNQHLARAITRARASSIK
ncbi:BTB/POZ domain-containing protein [Striga hermonthica]|uniref:BTB/POZ domain-containing protein n=1 Tax=Striga hermonthica TaxID=68872 RepID=A0A9N7NQQ1_STRHE|nr:BTB/POZ domain-containing protein [Striga hermonthica]